ncbi:MAG: hypothetical protein A2Z14_14405 [Chloroflexi bacterium RBG_16_48_8]|nr:MAG: hypothetical protein A2Z14_14405 [Chloroflexi bacterium RBG_16_48_8]
MYLLPPGSLASYRYSHHWDIQSNPKIVLFEIFEGNVVIMQKTGRWLVDLIQKFRTPILVSIFLILYLFSSAVITQGDESTGLSIGVAQWRHASGPEIAIQQETYDRLSDRLVALNLDDIEVILLPTSLKNAEDVDLVTSRYGVDILVWGWYDEFAVRGYVDIADATEQNGMTNSLAAYLENGGNPLAIRVLKVLGEFDYYEDGVSFCVPRWTP